MNIKNYLIQILIIIHTIIFVTKYQIKFVISEEFEYKLIIDISISCFIDCYDEIN